MTAEPTRDSQQPQKSRAKIVKPGRLPVSDITFPVPADRLTYEHPTE